MAERVKIKFWQGLEAARTGVTPDEGVPLFTTDNHELWIGDGSTAGGIFIGPSAATGDVTKVGTPVNDQIGVWTGDGTIEGDAALTFDTATDRLTIGESGKLRFGVRDVVSDAVGVATLDNIDVLGSTAVTTFEAALNHDNLTGFEAGEHFTQANITTTGIITSGTWQGTTIAVDQGGTGNTSYTDGQLLIGDSGGGNTLTKGTLTGGTNVTVVNGGGTITLSVEDASLTVAGVVELATSAEINTGTDTGRALSPDAFAGSNLGTKTASIQVTDGSGAITTGDGKAYLRIPSDIAGMNLISASAAVTTTSASGTAINVQLARGRQTGPTSAHAFVDMLSTAVTIDNTEYDSKDAATSMVVNTSNDDVTTGDLIRVDLDQIGSGPTTVLIVTLQFRLP